MKTFISILFMIGLMSSSAQAMEPNQKILGFTYNTQGLTLQVPSNGCTDKMYFNIRIAESFPMQLTFKKLKTDSCRAILPFGTELFWTWEEMGISKGSEFFITNNLEVIKRY